MCVYSKARAPPTTTVSTPTPAKLTMLRGRAPLVLTEAPELVPGVEVDVAAPRVPELAAGTVELPAGVVLPVEVSR